MAERSNPCGGSTFLTLGGLAYAELLLRDVLGVDSAMLFAGCFGALCTLHFAAPAAPLGYARNTILGHSLALAIAFAVHWFNLLTHMLPVPLPQVLAPSLAIGAMLHYKVRSSRLTSALGSPRLTRLTSAHSAHLGRAAPHKLMPYTQPL